jgi:hypothetical protein
MAKLELTPRHFTDGSGRYLGAFAGDAMPPAGAVEVSSPPPASERTRRRVDYVAELGKEPTSDPIEVIGDVLDILIAEIAARDQVPRTPEFGDMLRKIGAIKARHPKG